MWWMTERAISRYSSADCSCPASAPIGRVWQYRASISAISGVCGRAAASRSVQAFRPDFYLPAYDLYIEITTLNQKLVTKKNRKVRRLRELHPDIDVKVLYQRDYLNLLVKFGLEPPSQLVDDNGAGVPGLALCVDDRTEVPAGGASGPSDDGAEPPPL